MKKALRILAGILCVEAFAACQVTAMDAGAGTAPRIVRIELRAGEQPLAVGMEHAAIEEEIRRPAIR